MIVVVFVLVVPVVVVVTTHGMDLPTDFACRELFRVDISVSSIGCQSGYDAGEVARRDVLCGGSYNACRGDCSRHGHLS